MRHEEIKIGDQFTCGGNPWQVTDVGTRTVIAIPIKDGWMNGPPYAQAEIVFDEDDIANIEVTVNKDYEG